ncbi:Spy/CpxP family protein refolding chaperone [Psychrobacter lutiphocae]|uniref:Spy/CpxP family protein refolding chaperone n=1 Tax=Psychrobacter lutiphocae TaxID=540500 RepID=UPI0003656527|nr:Spy/CpxP family protein refolding chaperone [Psychrobacter lutiphocae]
MKKLIISSLLVASSSIAMVACAQNETASDLQSTPSVGQMQQPMAQGYHHGPMSGGYGMMGPGHMNGGHGMMGYGMGRHHMGGYGRMGGHMGGYGMRGGDYNQLRLTPEQQEKMQQLQQSQWQSQQGYYNQHHAQMQQMHDQAQALINSRNMNQAELNKLADQHAAISKAIFMQNMQNMHDMNQVLTDEQRNQLQQMRQQYRGNQPMRNAPTN